MCASNELGEAVRAAATLRTVLFPFCLIGVLVVSSRFFFVFCDGIAYLVDDQDGV